MPRRLHLHAEPVEARTAVMQPIRRIHRLRPMMSEKILCIGAAHIDRRARAFAAVVAGSSNPVRQSTGSGGVARNVAETQARLGAKVALLSRVGGDGEGDRLIAALAALGIDTSRIARAPDAATASYTALIEPDGELMVGIADMAIYDGMDEGFFATLKPRLAG